MIKVQITQLKKDGIKLKIDSNTKLYCLIGDPVSKSLSPEIHNYSFSENEINSKYVALNVLKGGLKEAINGIRHLGIEGFNVTIPHKVDIIKHLDDIDEEAKFLGAVNTVKNENGKLIGYNTDGKGFINVLKDKNVDIKNKTVAILGAGGAARAISIMLAKEGIKKIIVFNRTAEKAKAVIEEIAEKFPKVVGSYEKLEMNSSNLKNIDILINCTSVGMYPKSDEMPIDPEMLSSETVVCDIVYKPLETKLLKRAKELGHITIDGLNMLIYQAILSEEIWFNQLIDKAIVIDYFKKKI